jgi:hypothetical protein
VASDRLPPPNSCIMPLECPSFPALAFVLPKASITAPWAGRANDIGRIIQSGQVTLSASFFAVLRNRVLRETPTVECGRTILHTASTGCCERRVHGLAILNHGHVVKLSKFEIIGCRNSIMRACGEMTTGLLPLISLFSSLTIRYRDRPFGEIAVHST